MTKQETIERIKKILSVEGCFWVGELETEPSGVVVGELGSFVGLAEYFTEDFCEVNIYKHSSVDNEDEVDTYDAKYENLNEDVLQEILLLVEQREMENIRTEKRISN
jgi:hypothetical protein